VSLSRTLVVLRKDLRLGPRSPVFLWVLLLPLLITFVLQVAFGSLFDPQPRLGIVDEGSSSIPGAVEALDGIELTMLDDPALLRDRVESNDLDAGMVLPAGFDDAVRDGERPPLTFYIGGESLASNRIVLAVTTIDLVRGLEGRAAPVDVRIDSFGEDLQPLAVRLVPFITMYALLIAGVFLPSFSLADEREKHTLDALVVTPTRLSEVVLAKGVLGFVLAIAMALATLWLNGALDARPFALVVVLLIAGLLLVEVGLVYGTASKDVTGVFTLIKGTGFILLGPTIFYVFPDWPQWVARLFPTYWVIDPIYQVTINGAGLGDVRVDLLIALAVVAAMVVPIRWLTNRLETQLAIAA
jgi:ABC-2 type transport system permease protein